MPSYKYIVVCLLGLVSISVAVGIDVHSDVPTSCPPNQTLINRGNGEIAIGDFTPVNILRSGLVLNNKFINASGIYLLTVPESGSLTEVNFQGYIFDESIQFILDRQKPFFLTLSVVLYRLEESRHFLREGPVNVSYEPGATGSINDLNWNIQAGDSIGVVIPEMCNNASAMVSCPCQVNLKTNDCLSARYHPSLDNFNVLMNEDLQEVQVNLNVRFTVRVEESSVGNGGTNAAAIALGVILALVLLVCLGLLLIIIGIVIMVKTKYQKKSIKIDVEKSEVIAENISRSNSPQYHEYNEISDEPHVYEKNGGIQPNIVIQEKQRKAMEANEDTTSTVAVYTGYDNVEPFFEPATSRSDIITQLKDDIHIPVEKVENLEFKKILGSGEFGTVYKAIWRQEDEESNTLTEMEVAVKTVDKEVSSDEMVKFLQEAAIMGQFNHPSIVQILGIVVDDPVMIIIDLVNGGDLRNHLHKKREELPHLKIQEIQSTFLSYSRQICCAMTLMEKKGYIHRDLAARNILISSDGSNVKISDFGLSRDLQTENFYISHGGKVPVKWTAPEALQFRRYSHESDVWSYGCVLYEIWSLGFKPYHDWDNQKVIKEVAKGYRLPPPPGCPRLIYEVMMRCWHPDAKERGGFTLVSPYLLRPDFMVFKWSDDDVKKYDEEMRTLGAPLEKALDLFKELQHSYKKKPRNN